MTATDPTQKALHRATDAVAHAVPVTLREHGHQVAAMTFWLYDHADALGAAALDELADKLRPLRKEGTCTR